MVEALDQWLESFSQSDAIWYLKRLSGNETQASGSHQADPYFSKRLLFDLFRPLEDLK